MKFNSVREMRNALEKGDLYSIEDRVYLFIYTEEGSVCEYYIDNDRAVELENECRETSIINPITGEDMGREYWAAFLGWGGCIYDGEAADKYLKNSLDTNWVYTDIVPEMLMDAGKEVL